MDILIPANQVPPDLWEYFETTDPTGLTSTWTLGYEPQSDALCRACGAYYSGVGWSRLKKRMVDGKPQRVCRCGAIDWVAHFASFPSSIPRTAVLASTSEYGCCAKCGAAYERVLERVDAPVQSPRYFSKAGQEDRQDSDREYRETLVRQVGWQATCSCGTSEVVPCTVLDPFVGSGTTVMVARELGRKGVGVDISADYLSLASHRLAEIPLSLFNLGPEPEQPALPLES